MHYTTLIILSIFLFLSCKKDKVDDHNITTPTFLIGKWQALSVLYVEKNGSNFLPIYNSDFTESIDAITVEFTSNNSMIIRDKNKILKTYSIRTLQIIENNKCAVVAIQIDDFSYTTISLTKTTNTFFSKFRFRQLTGLQCTQEIINEHFFFGKL